MTQLNGYCLLASWHPCNDGRGSQLAFNRQMTEERARISVVYSVSVGIKALMVSIACRAKHQWNLTHSTFSSKVERETERETEREGQRDRERDREREDVALTTDGEAEFYDKHRSFRKEVLWRKVEACFQSLIRYATKRLIHSDCHFVPKKDSNPK